MTDRTDAARAHDDHDLIDRAAEVKQPSEQGRSGGNLQGDVATQAAAERVDDPEARERVTKEDDIAHGQREPADKRPDNR